MTHDEPRGFTLVEVMVVIVVLGILMVMGAAVLSRARVRGNESAAIGALRVINQAQFAYLNGCGHGYYATSFPNLATRAAGNSQGYISEDFDVASPQRNGYRFALDLGAEGAASGTDCMGRATQTAYYASGVPIVVGTTGGRAYATNQRGDIWQLDGATPPTEPFGPPARRAE